MNAETKRHIDAARQVLVGVVPNPTSQIDQITNALIYKFMDDMDQSAIKQGGDPSFFIGDLKDYAWTRLMGARIGNQERMNIYSEALIKFSQSKQLPSLFREVFKSAFLPYRSPEVLGLFLKEIAYFDYSHPEELGNAYEYLLSIMSSQGDAGQFRTPRHIIDFMVDVVNPTMEDKVLDPACGTGGFLVSAYKHILEQHTEKPLTPDQRKNLMGNFEGYDVDPGMVRIAQVNMYLHQFKNPKIVQYDSLSMEERWGDKFSVILANPPFMSPKGGVSTHSKFSIQSTRSEVLFVDYIMNHLRPQGRAGIIVPEGIIFQSGTAHKQLRKNLVEDGLYAVVSLPSGVFAPYSGVKTSILLFNSELAKKSKEILFVKIKNDGFDLGATRRLSQFNDLPHAMEAILEYQKYVMSGNQKGVEDTVSKHGSLLSTVEKFKIAESGDYNLSGDRYRVTTDYTNAKWPMVELGEVVEILDNKRKPITKSDRKSGQFPYYGATGILDYVYEYIFDERLVLIGEDGAKWGIGDKTAFIAEGKYWVNNHAHVVRPIKEKLIDTFLVSYLNSIDLSPFITGVTVPKLNQEKLRSIKIPLPPLEIQEQIVAELDGYQNIITGAKQILSSWKPVIIIDPEWKKVKLGEVVDILTDYTANGSFASLAKNAKYTKQKDYAVVVRLTDLRKSMISDEMNYVSEDSYKFLKKSSLFGGEYLIANVGANIGDSYIMPSINTPATLGPNMYLVKFSEKTLTEYIQIITEQFIKPKVLELGVSAAQPKVNKDQFRSIIIPLPPLEIQEQIVEKIEAERALIESSKKLIEIYEQKTKDTLAKLWEE